MDVSLRLTSSSNMPQFFLASTGTGSIVFTAQVVCSVKFVTGRVRVVAKRAFCRVMSVCTYQRGSHWTDVHEFWYWGLLRKSVHKIEISLKSNRSVGHFT